MESIERPSIAVQAPVVDARGARGMLGWFSRAPLRLMLAATFVVVSLVLGAAAAYAPRETLLLTETADGPQVVGIGVGSYAWYGGVRPGDVGWRPEGQEAAQGLVYLNIGGLDHGFLPPYEPPETQDLMLPPTLCAAPRCPGVCPGCPGPPALLRP